MARCADGARPRGTDGGAPARRPDTDGARAVARRRSTWRSRFTPRSPTRARSSRATCIVLSTEPEARPMQLTEGSWCDQLPVWSSDGARLAFLSDRITPGHQLPYTMTVDGGEPTLAASLVGSAESLAWSSDGTRLLVLAADPFSYGLDWSARAVNGARAGARSDRPPARRRQAPALPDRSGCRRGRRGRPARIEACGNSTGTATTSSWRSCRPATRARAGTTRRSSRWTSARGPRGPSTTRLADGGAGPLARCDEGRRRRGLRQRPRPARRQPRADRPGERDRPPIRGPICRRSAWPRGATTIRSGTRAPRVSATPAVGSGSMAGARSDGATTRSSATPSRRRRVS